MKKKALLINPPTGLYIREDRCQSKISLLAIHQIRPPIDLMYIAAMLERQNVECKIKDYPAEKKDWNFLKKDLEIFKPNFLIISATTPTLELDVKATDIGKEIIPEILTIAKGAHFFVFDKETLQNFPSLDLVIRGEQEITISEIAKAKDFKNILGISYRSEKEIIRNPDRPFIENLDILPFPARHLVNNSLYRRADTNELQTTIQTNRGCPNQCIFCLTKLVSGTKLRYRSKENIIEEIKECVNKYKINNFLFRGDTFTYNKLWVIELCRKTIDEKLKINWVCNSRVDKIDEEILQFLKKAGCWGISFGIESGSQDLLDKMNKKQTLTQAKEAVKLCKKFGILSFAYFLLGLPWETKETLKETLSFALELDSDLLEIHFAYPFPGTEFYRLAKEYKLLGEDFPKDAYSEPAIDTLYLKKNDLIEFKKKIFLKFLIRPKYILHTLKHTKSLKVFFNYIKTGLLFLFKILRIFLIYNIQL